MKKTIVAISGLLLLFAGTSALAQERWPNKPIRMIVPYAAGGYTDLTGRIVGRYLERELGQPVVIENRAGAGGIVGSAFVARAPADGYTLCMCSVGAISIAPVSQAVQYDPRTDFTPISIVSTITQTVIVNPRLSITSIPDLIAQARANPGRFRYGSSGAGGLMHFSVQLFEARTGTKFTHLPFRGGAPATAAVVSGEVDFAFANLSDALPQMEAKTVRSLAVTARERSDFSPDLPTMGELGVRDFAVETWNGVLAPPGLARPIVDRLSAILKRFAEDPAAKDDMAKIGASTVFTTPEAYRTILAAELAQWAALMKEIGDAKN